MMLLIPLLTLALVPANVPDQTPQQTPPPTPTPATSRSRAESDQVWHLTLPEAIRIGLKNSEMIRVIPTTATANPVDESTPAGPYRVDLKIAPVKDDISWNFKAAVMAHVRSIEQQYWALSAQQIALWSRETAVRLGEELLQRERSELEAGRSNPAVVAETQQQVENSKLNLITATADLITTERQLRNILGLPAAANHRITPDTAPTETKVELDWEQSVKQMLANQPDIALVRERLAATNFLEALGAGAGDDLAKIQRQREQQQALLRQAVHQATHTLARFYLEIDANHKQFRAAQELRGSAQQRFEIQRAAYEKGEISIDRVLDAVTQYTNGIAQEAQYKSSYNTSIAALEEARGSLLAADRITVTDQIGPKSLATSPSLTAEAKLLAPTTTKLRVSIAGVKVLDIEVERTGATTTPR